MMFIEISYQDYKDKIKNNIKLMTDNTFHKMIMTGSDYKEVEYQSIEELKKVLDIVKDDEELVNKEIIVLREMARTHGKHPK